MENLGNLIHCPLRLFEQGEVALREANGPDRNGQDCANTKKTSVKKHNLQQKTSKNILENEVDQFLFSSAMEKIFKFDLQYQKTVYDGLISERSIVNKSMKHTCIYDHLYVLQSVQEKTDHEFEYCCVKWRYSLAALWQKPWQTTGGKVKPRLANWLKRFQVQMVPLAETK